MENLTLFIIFGVIGVICIFNLTVGKKNRQKAAQHNKDVFGALRDKALDTFGQVPAASNCATPCRQSSTR